MRAAERHGKRGNSRLLHKLPDLVRSGKKLLPAEFIRIGCRSHMSQLTFHINIEIPGDFHHFFCKRRILLQWKYGTICHHRWEALMNRLKNHVKITAVIQMQPYRDRCTFCVISGHFRKHTEGHDISHTGIQHNNYRSSGSLRTLNHGFNHIDIRSVKREYTCIVLFSHCQQFFYFYVRHSFSLLHLFHGLDAVMCDRA